MQLIFEQTLSQQFNIGDERERNKNKLLAIETLGSTDILMENFGPSAGSPKTEVAHLPAF